MLIRKPRVGDRVTCPADRGDKPYPARIEWIEPTVHTNGGPNRDTPFMWCAVRKRDGTPGAVWPSHRLGYLIPQSEIKSEKVTNAN